MRVFTDSETEICNIRVGALIGFHSSNYHINDKI